MKYIKQENKIKSAIFKHAQNVVNKDILYDKFFIDSKLSGDDRYFQACDNFNAKPLFELFDDISPKLHKEVSKRHAKAIFIDGLKHMVNYPFSIMDRSKINKFTHEVSELFNKHCLESNFIRLQHESFQDVGLLKRYKDEDYK